MTELEYKHEVADLLRGLGWKTQQHEDSVQNFIPDLSFSAHRADGWIEIKYCEKIPKSLNAIKHYTHGQQDWLIQRGSKGSGHCYLWIGTPNAHFLWRWSSLAESRDLPWADAASRALVYEDVSGLCRAITEVVKRGGSYTHSSPVKSQRRGRS